MTECQILIYKKNLYFSAGMRNPEPRLADHYVSRFSRESIGALLRSANPLQRSVISENPSSSEGQQHSVFALCMRGRDRGRVRERGRARERGQAHCSHGRGKPSLSVPSNVEVAKDSDPGFGPGEPLPLCRRKSVCAPFWPTRRLCQCVSLSRANALSRCSREREGEEQCRGRGRGRGEEGRG